MNVIRSVIGPLATLVLFACASVSGENSLPIRSLARGGFSGIREPEREVIADKKAWEQIWSRHNKSRKPTAALPEVDFEKEMVIAVTMGTKRTGGYAVEIVEVRPADKKLMIAVQQTSPQPRAMTIQALTTPFHFVAVPKSGLKPEFVEAKPKEGK